MLLWFNPNCPLNTGVFIPTLLLDEDHLWWNTVSQSVSIISFFFKDTSSCFYFLKPMSSCCLKLTHFSGYTYPKSECRLCQWHNNVGKKWNRKWKWGAVHAWDPVLLVFLILNTIRITVTITAVCTLVSIRFSDLLHSLTLLYCTANWLQTSVNISS